MAADIRSKLPLHAKDFLILFALEAGERHGYGLVKDVEQLSGGSVRIDPANLYRSLRRLERDGLVEECEGGGGDGVDDQRRRYYRLTALGLRVVAAEAARLANLADAARARELIPRSEGAG